MQRLVCWLDEHDWEPVGRGYDHGGSATFAPYRCKRCPHEELRTIVDADPPVAVILTALVITFGSLSALLYVSAPKIAEFLTPFMR